jgi:hypothetical protein
MVLMPCGYHCNMMHTYVNKVVISGLPGGTL